MVTGALWWAAARGVVVHQRVEGAATKGRPAIPMPEINGVNNTTDGTNSLGVRVDGSLLCGTTIESMTRCHTLNTLMFTLISFAFGIA